MSLPHAILTALLEKPSSGLELTRRFDKSIGYFWSATHQQIYRELGKLEAAGYIRALPPQQPFPSMIFMQQEGYYKIEINQ